MHISIIIPAHNEEKRIYKTLVTYAQFFDILSHHDDIHYELLVVLNGCTDKTKDIVQAAASTFISIRLIDLGRQAGKGLAIKAGFLDALLRPNDLIGFVDADMATAPEFFYDLIAHSDAYDGVIASRYMPGSTIYPPRPIYKRWGSRLFYEPLIKLFFGLSYYDYQCGAKIFRRHVIQHIAQKLSETQWAFDVELLYLCKKYNFTIKELPTTWVDQADSKLSLRAGINMLLALCRLRLR